jgi:hypothetical protein
MSIASKTPKFNEKSYGLLDGFDVQLRRRILNILEDRMLEKNDEDITEDDVRGAISQAVAELMKKYGIAR